MSSLERRYRRLLLAYPAAHRREHGEEMLGVLLDAAAPGRARPGLADAADVVRGGLTLRARRANAAGWDDGLALVSLIATALMCALVPWGLLLVHFGTRHPDPSLVFAAIAALSWPLVLVVGVLASHRTAVGFSTAALLGLAAARPLHGVSSTGPWILLGAIAMLATACSAGPRRGLELLGRARSAALVLGVGLLGSYAVLASSYGYILFPRIPGPVSGPVQARAVFALGVLFVVGAVLRSSSAAARRATLLVAPPLAMVLVMLAQLTARFDPRLAVLYGHEVLAATTAGTAALALAALASRAHRA